MRRKAIHSLTMIGLILATVSVAQSRDGAAKPLASLKALTAGGGAAAHQLLLRIDGPYSFQPVRATADSLLLDLKGVKAGAVAKDGELPGGVFGGYHLLQYSDANGVPVVRVQLGVKQAASVKIEKDVSGLRLTAGAGSPAGTTAVAVEPVTPIPAQTSSVQPATKSAPHAPVTVSGVAIKSGPAGETYVDIAMTHPSAYNVLHLTNPERLVVDFVGARNATSQRSFSAQSEWVKSVRVGQFRENPAIARVVADLIGNPTFDVHAQPGGVRLEVRSRSAAKSAAATPPAVAAPLAVKAAEKPVEVAKTTPPPPVEEKSAETPVAPSEALAEKHESAKPAAPAAVPHTAVEIQNVLPASEGSTAVAATAKPEAPAESLEAIQAARAALTMGAPGTVNSSPQGQAGGASEQPKYTGEPISLNLKDVDLKDFFRLVHEISGLNIIVDPNVTGSVTLVLDAVPWDQALDIVLKNNRLGKTLEGNVLRIARVETITAEQEAATKLAAAREEAQPLVTVFRPVNYAKATGIATMLKSWAGGGALTKRGNILVDDRTNTLIISDIQTQIPVIESIISRLDKKAKQVSIEARIVLATAAFSRSLGVSLAGLTLNKPGSVMTGGATGVGATTSITAPKVVVTNPDGTSTTDVITRTLTPPVVTPSQAAAGGFGTYAISYAQARYIINAAIAAAETKSEAKTISRPSIITQNNVAGTVQQGSQIPIQTTINNTISIQYQPAALTLKVTPQVTEDGNIFLDINVTNSQPGAVLTSAGPSINTQSASTQVLVPDGGTVIFGGVTVTSRTKSATYVPLLGNIPVIGNLFKTRNVQDNDNELLFFVSPKILPG